MQAASSREAKQRQSKIKPKVCTQTSYMHTIIEPTSAALPDVYNHMYSCSIHFERIKSIFSFVARTSQRYIVEQQAL
jgi:hypothetical protein